MSKSSPHARFVASLLWASLLIGGTAEASLVACPGAVHHEAPLGLVVPFPRIGRILPTFAPISAAGLAFRDAMTAGSDGVDRLTTLQLRVDALPSAQRRPFVDRALREFAEVFVRSGDILTESQILVGRWLSLQATLAGSAENQRLLVAVLAERSSAPGQARRLVENMLWAFGEANGFAQGARAYFDSLSLEAKHRLASSILAQGLEHDAPGSRALAEEWQKRIRIATALRFAQQMLEEPEDHAPMVLRQALNDGGSGAFSLNLDGPFGFRDGRLFRATGATDAFEIALRSLGRQPGLAVEVARLIYRVYVGLPSFANPPGASAGPALPSSFSPPDYLNGALDLLLAIAALRPASVQAAVAMIDELGLGRSVWGPVERVYRGSRSAVRRERFWDAAIALSVTANHYDREAKLSAALESLGRL